MAVEEQRRLALYRAAATSWGEEVADTLVELVTPAGHEPATRADIEGVLVAMEAMDERLTAQMEAMDERLTAQMAAMDERWSERLGAMDARWEERSAAMEHRLTATFERGLREAITAQTRALVVSLLVSVVAIAGLAFGLSG